MSHRMLAGVVALCVAAAAVSVACKSNNIVDTTSNTTNNVFVTQMVGASGGLLAGPGGSTVSIPAKALAESVSIKLGELVPADYPSTMPAMPAGWVVKGFAFSFEPHGQTFALPVTVTVPYSDATPSEVALVTASPSGTWTTVPSAVIGDTSAQVDSRHFSYYAVVTGAPAASDAGHDATTADGGEGIPGPSCAAGGPGMTNCGPGGSGTDSCCASLLVTGGTYDRTYNTARNTNPDAGPPWTDLADPATVSNFRLDKYLVTVGRFRQFVQAWNNGAGWLPAAGSGKHTHLNGGLGLANSGAAGTYETGWVATDDSEIDPTDANLLCDAPYNTWTSSAGTQENLPINCVNWWESYAFCIWDGGFLPSEAEWRYAAAGGSQQREYPWGSVDPGTANLYAIYGCYYPNGTGSCTGVANIAPVGYAYQGAGLWGQLDMVGDMWVWNLDWDANYTATCTDCAYLSASSKRADWGGDFGRGTSYLLPSYRDEGNAPTDREDLLGFRCARSAP